MMVVEMLIEPVSFDKGSESCLEPNLTMFISEVVSLQIIYKHEVSNVFDTHKFSTFVD